MLLVFTKTAILDIKARHDLIDNGCNLSMVVLLTSISRTKGLIYCQCVHRCISQENWGSKVFPKF